MEGLGHCSTVMLMSLHGGLEYHAVRISIEPDKRRSATCAMGLQDVCSSSQLVNSSCTGCLAPSSFCRTNVFRIWDPTSARYARNKVRLQFCCVPLRNGSEGGSRRCMILMHGKNATGARRDRRPTYSAFPVQRSPSLLERVFPVKKVPRALERLLLR
jgi:hypothetical protein